MHIKNPGKECADELFRTINDTIFFRFSQWKTIKLITIDFGPNSNEIAFKQTEIALCAVFFILHKRDAN